MRDDLDQYGVGAQPLPRTLQAYDAVTIDAPPGSYVRYHVFVNLWSVATRTAVRQAYIPPPPLHLYSYCITYLINNYLVYLLIALHT